MANALTKTQYDRAIKMLDKDGKLTASGILAEARKSNSPFHSLFEWDDSKAASQYRLEQARRVIKRINVSIEEPEDRLVHCPIIEGKGEGSYKRVSDAVSNISDFEAALDEALSRLRAAERSVDDLQSVAQKDSPDTMAMLGIAMKSIHKIASTLDKLH